MKRFIDLVTDVTKDKGLFTEVTTKLNSLSHTELSAWFKEKGYDVNEEDSKKLVENKDHVKSSTEVGLGY
ncbi:MAG: hypothetical protein PF447_07370 [Spirochaetaceae bacterium]|nr:hypothetical protein [Spirochaetaceae bacterium]